MKIEFLIRDIREKKNITLQELSKISGISVSHINDVENNLKIPSIIVLELIAKGLKVNINELYNIYN